MNVGKTLAMTAVTGMLAALTGCGGNQAEPQTPATTDVEAPAAKDCCTGKNECKGKSGCKTESNSCAGQNECKGKGTACPHAG